MAELWAVDNDPDDHGEGRLIVEGPKTVKIQGKPVVTHETRAGGDNAGHVPPSTHTKSGSWSESVFAYNRHAHRNKDERNCGAKTVVEGQSTVKVG